MSRYDEFEGIESIDGADAAAADPKLPAGFARLRPIPVGQVRYTRDSEFHAQVDLLIDEKVWRLALGPARTVQVAWDAERRHVLLTPAPYGLHSQPCGHPLPDGSIPAYEISVPVYRGFDAPVASLPLIWAAEAGGLLLSWPAPLPASLPDLAQTPPLAVADDRAGRRLVFAAWMAVALLVGAWMGSLVVPVLDDAALDTPTATRPSAALGTATI